MTHRPRATGLVAGMCDLDELVEAARLATRGRTARPAVAWFRFEQETRLARLRDALLAGAWRPGPIDVLDIRDPKPRVIACAPVADRVVHLLVSRALDRVWGPSLSPGDYACRPGFGQHRAVLALQGHMVRHAYAVHLDVRAYFPSIDPVRLCDLLAGRIDDPGFLEIVGRMLAQGPPLFASPRLRAYARLDADWPPPGRGIPIGSSVSQYLAAHVYLNAFDHWVKRGLRVPGYLRYVDDIFLFGDREADLVAWRAAVAEWLATHRGLRLKHPNAPVIACRARLSALGFGITRNDRHVFARAHHRVTRRVHAALAGRPGPDIHASLASAAGLLSF